MESVLSEILNDSQREAVTSTEGVIRVIAGAGSGKTRALAYRFAWLVSELGISAGNIMCATFTNKAAQEMKTRIRRLVGDNDTAYINTFHGFCVTVLNEEGHLINYPKSIMVLDNSDINSMLDIIYEERHLTARDMTYKNARDMIEILKTIERPDYYLDLADMSTEMLREKYMKAAGAKNIIFYGYLYQQKKCFGLDYNDLIILTLYIFEKYEEARLKWQKRLEYIMVDEFQDIDPLQYRLLCVLCGYHGNLFVVGDPDQTIYTWRGADIRFLLDLDKEFPSVKTIMMNNNYRSSPQILEAANTLISNNKNRIKKDLVPNRPTGKKVLYHHAVSAAAEAEWICAEINRLIDEGTDASNICLLFRNRSLTRTVETVFMNRKLPYHIYSGVQFFDRAEIKDALSYLRMLAFRDDLSFVRTVNRPKRNLGKSRMEFLYECVEKEGGTLYSCLARHLDDEKIKGTKAAAFISLVEEYSSIADSMSISDLFSAVMEKSGLERTLRTEGDQEKLDNLAELKQLIADYETSCGEELDLVTFLERVAMFTNTDGPEVKGKVKLMTIHAAKGLEFAYIFICGLNENILPSGKTRTLEAMEEERRLCFVAFTRAEKGLFLSDCEGSTAGYGFQYPSRFVLELGHDVLEYDEPVDESLVAGAAVSITFTDSRLSQNFPANELPVGTRVFHPVFGDGTVLGTNADTGKVRIKFDGITTQRTLSREKLNEIK